MTDLPTRVGALPTLGGRDGWTATVEVLAGLVALVPAAALLVVRVGINAPVGPALPYDGLYDPIASAALAGPAFGAVLLSVATEDDLVRVGLAFAGVFGLLLAAGAPVTIPATGAILGATALLVVAHPSRPLSADETAATLVAVAFLAGVAVSTAAMFGYHPAETRPLGSTVALVAVAASPVFVDWTHRSVFAGAIAAAAFAGFAISAPFVAGAASLVAGGIVGVSLPVLVLAVLGGTTVVATGVERRQVGVLLAGLAVLVAGVPATVPRGLTLVVGLALLITTTHD